MVSLGTNLNKCFELQLEDILSLASQGKNIL